MAASPKDMQEKIDDDNGVMLFQRTPDGNWGSSQYSSGKCKPVDPSTLDSDYQRVMQTVQSARGGHFYPAEPATTPAKPTATAPSWGGETDAMFAGIFAAPVETKENESSLLKRYNVKNKEHALRRAAAAGKAEDVNLAIQLGANINAVDDNPASRKTALHHATSRGHQAVIEVLRNAGARDDIKDADGKTPQDYQVVRGISPS